ncbi:kinase [Pyrrhoderma noxium]|uniref:Kinase n=1 Tax=Pyrrhoderma noxium TaxID=2282107 RepID=A0A286UE64_9AGAM|nr:kinase [Pyrrhoderma noxium]
MNEGRTIIPTKFKYQVSCSLKSWLWRLWLSFPDAVRARPEEALATEFVRRHTTIPVPKVLDVIYDTFIGEAFHGKSFIMITKEIPGRPLYGVSPKFRIHTATPEQKETFKNTLFDWLTQLRSIPPPHPHKISGFLGGGLRSYRIESGIRVGPYKNPAELHGQNFCGARADVPGMAEDPIRMQRLIDERPNKKYRICLTHGDLQPHNLLVDDAGRPCGLVDWECASWMPEYWELTSAVRMYLQRDEDWCEIWRSMFPEYEDDLDVEIRTWLWYVTL